MQLLCLKSNILLSYKLILPLLLSKICQIFFVKDIVYTVVFANKDVFAVVPWSRSLSNQIVLKQNKYYRKYAKRPLVPPSILAKSHLGLNVTSTPEIP